MRKRAKLGLSLGVSLALLVGIEAAYRVQVYGTRALSPRWMASLSSGGHRALVQASAVPGLPYEYRPSQSFDYKLVEMRTNAHGMRDVERDFEKPPGVVRIAAVGDSFTMGMGVEFDDIWPRQLEALLAARGEDARYEVLNFGTSGYDLHQYAAVIEHKLADFDPDLIGLGVILNDRWPEHERVTEVVSWEPVDPPATGLLESAWLRPHFLLDAIAKTRGEPLGEGRRLVEPPGPRENVRRFSEAGADRVEVALEPIRAHAQREGWPVLLVYLTIVEEDRLHTIAARAFRIASRRLGFAYLDTSSLFAGTDPLEQVIFRYDWHPNAASHALYAEGILAALEEHMLLAP